MEKENSACLRSGSSGFTLIELMVVVALVAILATLAAPSFERVLASNRISAQSNQLLLAFQLARSEALKRSRPVSVCASNDLATCAGTWDEGWIVVTDDEPAGTTSVDPNQVLRAWGELDGDVTFNDVANLVGFVRYLPDGRADDVAGSFPLAFRVQLPACRFDLARELDIAATGRAGIQPADCL